jgi:hypothetical protein
MLNGWDIILNGLIVAIVAKVNENLPSKYAEQIQNTTNRLLPLPMT